MVSASNRRLARALAAPLSLFLFSGNAGAQFLRLGPFDFSAQADVEAIYTTNVEEERPSESTAEREDYYLRYGMSLSSQAELSQDSDLSIDLGFTVEKHFNRPDLDNSEDPFLEGAIDYTGEFFRYFTLRLGVYYDRTSDSLDDKVVVGGVKKRRQIGTEYGYYGGVGFNTKRTSIDYEYTFDAERFDDEDFRLEETDEWAHNFSIDYMIFENLGVGYEYENEKVDKINVPDDDTDWKATETITLDFRQLLFRRPELTYSLGLENEDSEEGGSTGWEITHTLDLRDTRQIAPVLTFDYYVTYEYEETREEDDIALEYGATLEHLIKEDWVHRVYAVKEPADTLGTNQDTDTTEFGYEISIKHLLLWNLNLDGSYSFEQVRPVTGPDEDITEYELTLWHEVPVSLNLHRRLEYIYSLEQSSLFPNDDIEEHEVILTYTYVF